MQQSIIAIIVILTTVVFVYSTFRANRLIVQLKRQISIPSHWSGRINVKELKVAYSKTVGPLQQKQLAKAITLLRLSKAVVYVCFVVVVLIILFWK